MMPIINDPQLPITRVEAKGPAVDAHRDRKEKGQPEPHWMDGGAGPAPAIAALSGSPQVEARTVEAAAKICDNLAVAYDPAHYHPSLRTVLKEAAEEIRTRLTRPREQEGGKAAEPVAYLKTWEMLDGDEPVHRSRVDRDKYCEPWLERIGPTITPLYAHPAPLPADGWKEAALEIVKASKERYLQAADRHRTNGSQANATRCGYQASALASVQHDIEALTAPTPPASTEGQP